MRRSASVVLLFCLAASAARGAASPKYKAAEDAPSRDGWSSMNMEAQAVMGELQLQSGDLGGARKTFQKSLDLGTKVRGPRADVAAQSHYRTAEISLAKGEYGEARRNLEILIQRYPETEWADKGRNLLTALPDDGGPAASQADEPYVPAMESSSAEEALGRLRAAIDEGRTEAALAEAYDFHRRYPSRRENAEVDLAAGALHLRRGEAARAVRFLKPLAEGSDRALKYKALHLIGAALASLGLDEATLKLVPEADAAGAADRWLALAQVWRAAAEERMGRKDDAAEHYRAVSASGHESPVKAYALAAIAADWDRKGRTARARDALRRAGDEAAKWGLLELRESTVLSEANLLQREGKLDEAQKAYRGFTGSFPDSPLRAQALYQRGLCLKKLERPEEAAEVFDDLARRHPASAYAADAHLQLGQLYTELGKSDKALSHYKQMGRASEAQDADREALLLMAQVHYNKKRWKDAIPLYKKYLEGAAPGAKTKQVDGLLLVATWQNDKEDPDLTALVAKYPDHQLAARIRWDLAAKAYKTQDWDSAERLFRKHIEDNPHAENIGSARYYRAESLRQLRRIEDAAGAYRKFLAVHPKHPRARDAAMALGAMLYEDGDAAGAAAAYAMVGGTGADAADAAFNRALALAKAGKERDEEKAWLEFTTKFPKHEKASWAWAQIAKSREERDDLAGAADAYPRATGGEERMKALYALGRLQERRKKTKEAKNAYERLRALTPKDDAARLAGLLRLALMLELEDQPQAAAPLYMEVLKRSERGSQTFETARKRLESLSRDKSLVR
ncbi:MAG: tetratricopeptide repeat protein [Elusimicrobiota bacterium]|nr:tetratricopeptide repeat protein [Elusimicrobiota bacterium]